MRENGQWQPLSLHQEKRKQGQLGKIEGRRTNMQ